MTRFPELIDATSALTALREVVDEMGPEHRYWGPVSDRFHEEEDCRYVNEDNTPDCLVARAAHRLGVPLEELRKYEHRSAIEMGPEPYRQRPRPEDAIPLFTEKAAQIMWAAQLAQDGNEPWRIALGAAERKFTELCGGEVEPR